MAISTFAVDEAGSNSPSSTNLKRDPSNLNQLVKIIAENQDITSAAKQKRLNRIKELRSPYVFAERGVQFLSGITERKIIHKRPQNFKSSFPLASRIYRANSDEFKPPKRTSKKVKKSVLTLPYDLSPSPCTVSDLNENEYNRKNEELKVETKRKTNQRRHRREKKNNFVDYDDRDARHANLVCSSDETIKHSGDFKNSRKGRANHSADGELKAHDVWTVLRNINQFQFKNLPPESRESSVASSVRSKKKSNKIRHYKHPERRLIETCRTEQISYIASFEIDDRKTVRATSPTCSTSLDRVTVINNSDARRTSNKLTNKRQSIKPIKPNQPNNRVTGRNMNRPYPRGHAKAKENKNVHFNERNKIIKGRQANTRQSVDSVYKVSNLSGGRDSDGSSYHERAKYNDDDDDFLIPAYDNRTMRLNKELSSSGYQSPNSSAAKSSNQFSSSRCQSPNSSAAKSSMRSFEKLDNTRVTGKVVLKKERNVSPCESIMERPRLVTTMPSAAAMPKISPVDVKRRLSLIRFPLVILGNDQLSSTIEVPDYEAPQFDGLDKQVWPFMVEWSKKPSAYTKTKLNKQDRIIATSSTIANYDTTQNKARDKRALIDRSDNTKKVESYKCGAQNVIVTSPAQLLKKPKPISQIRDKMFKLLYKKSSQQIFPKKVESDDTDTVYSNENLVELVIKADVFTETEKIRANVPKAPEQLTISLGGNEKMVSMPVKYTKRPWAKGKWASDFIENVIKKIRNGSYYSHDINKICGRGNIDKNGVSIQTTTDVTQTLDVTEQSIVDSCDVASELSLITDLTVVDPLAAIPGFDESFTELKIDSLTMNQISVKHCYTNVILQFDVKIQDESAAVTFELHKSLLDSCFVPLPDLNNQIQVFKCPTTFINAMLPAELCSTLPRIKREFIDSKAYEIYSPRPLPSTVINLNSKLLQLNISPLPTLPISTITLDGEFSRVKLSKNPVCSKTVVEKAKNGLRSKLRNIRKLLANVSVKALIFCKVNPKSLGFKELKQTEPELKRVVEPVLPETPCTAIEFYKANDRPVQYFDTSCFRHILETLNKYQSLTLHLNCTSFTQTLTVTNSMNNLTVGMLYPVGQNSMTVIVNKLKMDSLFNGLANHTVTALPEAKIAEFETSSAVELASIQNGIMTKKPSLRNVTCNKNTKRRGYIKLYKKCKSSSNISGEKHSTALSKVTSIDDFFQALGTAKTLSSIFDGSSSRNILSAVNQMKNWITDITPRQVMLVLLLVNKKDTPNLMRYRPVLLQGIAVNRITRASELDMEIEVIERENLNKLSQCNDSLLRCMENHDSLLEELCWIAKTTASDYQKPFDESSEKLLKSLLQKRKKLNPSYLRVMARYVGLGLLKGQNNNN